MPTLIYRHCEPNIPAYTDKNNSLCHSPASGHPLSIRCQMKMITTLGFGFNGAALAPLPQDHEDVSGSHHTKYEYRWKWGGSRMVTANELNSRIASLYANREFNYGTMSTGKRNISRLPNGRPVTFLREGEIVDAGEGYHSDSVSFSFSFLLIWDSALNFWEWVCYTGEIVGTWWYIEKVTEWYEGHEDEPYVYEQDEYTGATASFDIYKRNSYFDTDYNALSMFAQGHSTTDLRLGNGIPLYSQNMVDTPASGSANANWAGTVFGGKTITISATRA